MLFGRLLATCALAAGVVSCAAQSPSENAVQQTQAIVAGEASGAEQDSIVLLRVLLDDASELVCTATLVGPNLVLTARHCVSYLNEGLFRCSVRGELLDNPEGGGRLGLHLPAERVEIYGQKTPRKAPLARGTRIISTLSPNICTNDVAFVVLDKPVDLPVAPMRLGRPAMLHEPSVLVGFGLTGDQTGIDYKTQPRLQKRDLDISGLGPDSLADGVTTVPPRALIMKGASGCIGDSGGPLLAQSTGAVLGVYSLQVGESCVAPDVRHQMVHVPPFVTLIDEAFGAAGCLPTPEPDLEPSAAAGSAGAGAGGDSNSNGGGGNPSEAGAPSEEPERDSKPKADSSCAVTRLPAASLSAFDALALLLGVGAVALRSRRRERR